MKSKHSVPKSEPQQPSTPTDEESCSRTVTFQPTPDNKKLLKIGVTLLPTDASKLINACLTKSLHGLIMSQHEEYKARSDALVAQLKQLDSKATESNP